MNQPDFARGRDAVRALKNAGIPVRLAFWAYFQDAGEWRFVVVALSLDRQGPRGLYSAVQKAFTENNISIPLRQVVLARPGEPLASLGSNARGLAEPFGAGQSSVVSALNVTVDIRYIYR